MNMSVVVTKFGPFEPRRVIGHLRRHFKSYVISLEGMRPINRARIHAMMTLFWKRRAAMRRRMEPMA